MQEAQNVFSQRRLNIEFSQKLIINETILFNKIQLILKYYAQVKKSQTFFNSKVIDTNLFEKQIFDTFFSTKNYQGQLQFQDEDKEYLVLKQNFKFITNIKNVTDSEQKNDQNEPQQVQTVKNQVEYHYFGQAMKLSQSEVIQASNVEQRQENIFHGFGLQLKFQQKPQRSSNNLLSHHSSSRNILVNCYFGQFNNGLKHGFGMKFKHYEYSNQTIQVYMGNFINGQEDDTNGIWIKIKVEKQKSENEHNQNLTFSYLEKYYGSFVNGKKHGQGKISSSQLFYDGQWRFDKPEGKGQLWTLLSYYKGKFKSGLKHGQGKQLFKNGDSYEGEYSNNKPNGNGKYYWKKGDFYEGQFKNGLRDGKGLWRSGSESYEGSYLNDKKSGQGIYYWENGQTYYKGSFCQDLRHGYGQMNWDNRKSIYRGNWKDGIQQGYGEVYEFIPQTKKIKLIKKGEFVKGQLLQQIVEKQENSSLQAAQNNKVQTQETDQFGSRLQKHSEPMDLKHQNLRNQNVKYVSQNYKKALLNKVDKQQMPIKAENMNKKRNFIRSQNNLGILKKEIIAKNVSHQKQRYHQPQQNGQITEKQHLYGSVYLIKSGRKRTGLSVHNIPKPSKQQYRSSSFSNPNPKPIKNEALDQQKLQHINRRSSSKTSNPVHERTKLQTKKKSAPLQNILAKKNMKNFEQNLFPDYNQKQRKEIQGFQSQSPYLQQLQPLIIWHNFHRKRRFMPK